jgi:spermidine synthase
LGAGTMARNLSALGYTVDIVEIDPKIVDIARDYFDFPAGEYEIFLEDVRTYLQRTQAEQYGLVFLDIPGTGSVPFHLYNQDAFKLIDKVLVPNGLLITNQVLFLMPGANQIAHSTAATLSSVFPNVEAFDIYPDESDQGLTNLLMIASSQAPSHKECFLTNDHFDVYLCATGYTTRANINLGNPIRIREYRAGCRNQFHHCRLR